MDTSRIFKEEINNLAIWNTIIRDLQLPEDADEIVVKIVTFDSPSKRGENNRSKNENRNRT